MASSDCETAFCGVPKDSPPVWQYVGQGQGNFERVEQYAPQANGSYIQQAAPKGRPIWIIEAICFGTTFCLLLVVLLVLLLGRGGQETTTTTTEPPKKTGGGECQAGLSDYKNLWPAVTMNECCITEGRGCSSCDVQLSASWTPNEKDYCCLYRQLGCTPPPVETYGCDLSVQYQWTHTEQHHCCYRKGLGCAPPGCDATCALGGVAKTCSMHFQDAAYTFQSGENNACSLARDHVLNGCGNCADCSLERSGCRVQVEYDCYATSADEWTDNDKHDWCCTHHAATCQACRRPVSTGYVVHEHSLHETSFSVHASCAAGYTGTAMVSRCSTRAEHYQLQGCQSELCTRPVNSDAYSVTEYNLHSPSFSVSAVCAHGFTGNAHTHGCTAQDRNYQLQGCSAQLCARPYNTAGYQVTEHDLHSATFHAYASCGSDYFGTASVTGCSVSDPHYHLEGCVHETLCSQPHSAYGYELREHSLYKQSFHVHASCEAGFTGWATVTACSSRDPHYSLTGCSPSMCQTPHSTVGYSNVAEHSLSKAQFHVYAGCAPGFSGTAVANECETSGEVYTLSGCAPQGFTAKVVMGSSLRDATKCVLPHEPVVCDSRAAQHQRDDKWPDRFDVFEDPQNPYQVCAHRTDIEHGWGLPLVLHCQPKYSGTNGPTYEQIAIGPSTSATKCVTPRVPVMCDATAGHHGRLDTKSDTFKIVHQGDKICATRTDVDSHWGLDLVVLCHKDEHFQEVVVGSSLLSTKKCVTPDLAVKCRPHASVSVDQQNQNAGYPDQFVVSMENGQICAQRKDSKNIWGVNLVLKCEKAHDGITAVRAES